MTSDRNSLIVRLMPVAQRSAYVLKRRLPASARVDVDDLVGAGYIALIRAVDNFDPTYGVPLIAYVRFRVGRALLDFLREQDMLNRSERRAARKAGESPGEFLKDEDFWKRQAEILADHSDLEAEALLRDELDRRMDRIYGRDRILIQRTVLGHESLITIGEEWGVGQSRISQLRKRALQRLREAI